MILKRKNIYIVLYAFSVLILFFVACRRDYTPKPMGYFRIDLPEKEYQKFDSTYPYTFEYPVYGKTVPINKDTDNKYWMNIEFPDFNSKIYLTYHEINNDFSKHTEDARKLAYKHAIKAEAIPETFFSYPDKNVHGIVYDIKGNTATSLVFFVSDSLKHFLYGALYFNSRPNKDSLAPVINFFRDDIIHLINTIEWKNL